MTWEGYLRDPQVIKVGEFEVSSGTLMLSDPCYTRGTWCQLEVDNVANGTWHAYKLTTNEGEWGTRVAALIARNWAGVPTVDDILEQSGELPGSCGVDSGQCGIFDEEFYRRDDLVNVETSFKLGLGYRDEEGDQWYEVCCDLTLCDEQAGIVLGRGVVSTSGFGDGGYGAYVARDAQGQVVQACIQYIVPEEDLEDEDLPDL